MSSLTQFGQYLLLKKIATGGMAELFLGKQIGIEGFEKPVVLKRILSHLAENDEFTTMFLDEARVAARLNHPRIVQIFDLGQEGDAYFIAMEYIRGHDLRKLVKRAQTLREPLPLAFAVQILVGVLEGLDHAHRKTDERGRPINLVHRDVSPQNILVSYEGDVKLVDFGIAKASTQIYQTRVGILKGKYAYMSPEQAQGKPVDRRSDIFAAGILLWEITTGQRLFRQASEIETLRKVIDCQIETPSSVDPEYPQELEKIVLRALEKETVNRFQDAREMQLALTDFMKSRGMVASSARLAEYMRRLFAKEIEVATEEVRILLEARPDTPLPQLPMPPELPQSDQRTPPSSSKNEPPQAPASRASMPPFPRSPAALKMGAASSPTLNTGTPSGGAPSGGTPGGGAANASTLNAAATAGQSRAATPAPALRPTAPHASGSLGSSPAAVREPEPPGARAGGFLRRPLDPRTRRLTLLVVTLVAVVIAAVVVVWRASQLRVRPRPPPTVELNEPALAAPGAPGYRTPGVQGVIGPSAARSAPGAVTGAATGASASAKPGPAQATSTAIPGAGGTAASDGGASPKR